MEQDGFYIGTANQCDYYNQKVCDGEGFNTSDGDTTTKWANKVEHPTEAGLFSIHKHNNYTHATMTWVQNLDETWEQPSE